MKISSTFVTFLENMNCKVNINDAEVTGKLNKEGLQKLRWQVFGRFWQPTPLFSTWQKQDISGLPTHFLL